MLRKFFIAAVVAAGLFTATSLNTPAKAQISLGRNLGGTSTADLTMGSGFQLFLDEGSIANPSLSFTGAVTNGFYNTTAAAAGVVDLLGFAQGGNDLGAWGVATGTLTATQVRKLNATPVEVIAAPGAGFAIVVESIRYHLDFASVAYDNVAAGEDLVLEYASSINALGAVCDEATCINANGGADQNGYVSRAGAAGMNTNKSATAINITIANGEWASTDDDTDGDSPLRYNIRYHVVKLDLS